LAKSFLLRATGFRLPAFFLKKLIFIGKVLFTASYRLPVFFLKKLIYIGKVHFAVSYRLPATGFFS